MVHCLNDSSCLHCCWDHCSCPPEHKQSQADVQRESREAAVAAPGQGSRARGLLAGAAAQGRDQGSSQTTPAAIRKTLLGTV